MEVGAAADDESVLSHSHQMISCSKRLAGFGSCRWKYVLLLLLVGVVLVSYSSSSLVHFTSAHPLEFTPSAQISFPGPRGDEADLIGTGRQLLIDRNSHRRAVDPENAAGLSREGVKEAEDEALLQKVANGNEDYENVALKSGAEGKGLDWTGKQTAEDLGIVVEGEKRVDDNEATTEDGKSEHSGVEKLLDRLQKSDDDDKNEDDGRFNKTISDQVGVLETVARVGGRSFDDGDDEEELTKEEKEVLRRIDEEILGRQSDEAGSDGGEVKNSGDMGDVDVTWLDKIMGQADQPHKLEPQHVGRNASLGPPKKNSTREKLVDDNAGYHQVEDVPRLIDREDNEYVISNPGKNKMRLQEDLTLISDIVFVIVAAALGGTLCGVLGQPVILGYLAAGMVVGPGGLHLVHELVQVETLAQFGVVFLLFVLGVEFNPSKMHGIHNVTLGGGCLQIGTAMLLGGLFGSSISQGVFIGAFLSMSSTAVVVKCLMDSRMSGTEHGQIMLGTLILQDCALGLLLAVMPALAAKESDAGTFALALSKAAVFLLIFCGFAWVLAKIFIPHFLRSLVQLTRLNSELFLLGALGVCLAFALISQSMGLSLEVGAFVGGLVLSGRSYTEQTLHQVEPIRNVFAALFLASIGMIMNPMFLWEHIDILMASLGVVFIGKTFLFAAVVRTFGYSTRTSVSVGIALAQIGEFAFILLSRAQGLGLVSKKLYLLLMGTSALSLVLTPFAFKIVIHLNPPGQSVFRKISSKPAHSHGIQARQDTILNSTGFMEGEASSYWSQENLRTHNGGVDVSKPVQSMLPSILKGQDEHRESMDMEGSRSERPSSPAGVTLRRPYQQVFSGQWNTWRKELGAIEDYDQKR